MRLTAVQTLLIGPAPNRARRRQIRAVSAAARRTRASDGAVEVHDLLVNRRDGAMGRRESANGSNPATPNTTVYQLTSRAPHHCIKCAAADSAGPAHAALVNACAGGTVRRIRLHRPSVRAAPRPSHSSAWRTCRPPCCCVTTWARRPPCVMPPYAAARRASSSLVRPLRKGTAMDAAREAGPSKQTSRRAPESWTDCGVDEQLSSGLM